MREEDSDIDRDSESWEDKDAANRNAALMESHTRLGSVLEVVEQR